jgi:DNA helicase-2/ATP-dependent DNA helicase PcrA
MMLQVSDYLSEALDNLPTIYHDVAFDAEGPALAASAIAGLLESDPDHALVSRRLLQDLVRHMRGRSGPDGPSKAILTLSGVLSRHLEGAAIRGKNRLRIIEESNSIAGRRADLVLSGEAGEDWLAVRELFSGCESEVLRQIADDAKYLRLLRKGTMLRARLGDLWRSTGGYPGKHEPLIDRATWDRVQALLGGHVYQSHALTYASELMQCAHCGHPITGEQDEER